MFFSTQQNYYETDAYIIQKMTVQVKKPTIWVKNQPFESKCIYDQLIAYKKYIFTMEAYQNHITLVSGFVIN